MRLIALAILLASCGGAVDEEHAPPPTATLKPDAGHVDAAAPLCCEFADGTGELCGCNGVQPDGFVMFYDVGDNAFWCGAQPAECAPQSPCSATTGGVTKLGHCTR